MIRTFAELIRLGDQDEKGDLQQEFNKTCISSLSNDNDDHGRKTMNYEF